jgi:hypothetical protein
VNRDVWCGSVDAKDIQAVAATPAFSVNVSAFAELYRTRQRIAQSSVRYIAKLQFPGTIVV